MLYYICFSLFFLNSALFPFQHYGMYLSVCLSAGLSLCLHVLCVHVCIYIHIYIYTGHLLGLAGGHIIIPDDIYHGTHISN